MAGPSASDLIRGLYDYHWWANRRLYDVAVALGEDVSGRDVGRQFSYPTIRRMFGHLYGADWLWLARWKGTSPTRVPGDEFARLADVRGPWDALETEQFAFIKGLGEDGLARVVPWTNTEGKAFSQPLWALLQHVANHATHHRSEIATMLTMVSGSPPDTGIGTYRLLQGGPGEMSRRWA
jgi:uncharacterized damage-inducible protein DinB